MYSTKLSKGMFEIHFQEPQLSFYQVKQVHGDHVVSISENTSINEIEADGIIALWNQGPFTLAIKTADCLPITIMGEKGVAHLHAGWRGVHQQIYLNPQVKKLNPTHYYIGPHIRQCCFEVQEDFKQNFPNSSQYFSSKDQKIYFSLTQKVIDDLESNYPGIKSQVANECTCCDLQFFSYRRDATAKRNWNLYHYTSNL
ncbi:MAG: polyphenol oxidase family protein [Oligoflexia bacterium]|nr:polyphenol oxidase family protein [Oligoflexia bacterium]